CGTFLRSLTIGFNCCGQSLLMVMRAWSLSFAAVRDSSRFFLPTQFLRAQPNLREGFYRWLVTLHVSIARRCSPVSDRALWRFGLFGWNNLRSGPAGASPPPGAMRVHDVAILRWRLGVALRHFIAAPLVSRSTWSTRCCDFMWKH